MVAVAKPHEQVLAHPYQWWRARQAALAPKAGGATAVGVPTVTYANGQSMVFDGSTYARSTVDVTTLDGLSAATMASWVYLDTTFNQFVWFFHQYTTNQRIWALQSTGTVFRLFWPPNSTGGHLSTFTTSGVTADAWHLLVMRVDGDEAADDDKVRLWVDGAEVAISSSSNYNDPQTFNNPAGTSEVWLGALDAVPTQPINTGLLNKQAIWTRALTVAEIETTLYNAGTDHDWNAGSLATGLAHLWETGHADTTSALIKDVVGSTDLDVTGGALSTNAP